MQDNHYSTAPVPAIVLAGGKIKPELARATGASSRALVKIGGRPMVSIVAEALARARLVAELVIVGPGELTALGLPGRLIEDTGSFVSNIRAGIEATGGRGKALIASADIPLITPPVIEGFIEDALAATADFCYPIIPRAVNDARFPDMKRTFVRLRDGTFTGGNVVLIESQFLLRNESLVREVYDARKQPLKLAGILGWGLLMRLLMGRASIREAEEKASRILGGTARAIIVHTPELGADVDRPEDIPAAERYLAEMVREGDR